VSAAWRFLLDENSDPKTASHLVEDDIHAEHVRDALGQGADEEADLLPYATEHDLAVVASDASGFGDLPPSVHGRRPGLRRHDAGVSRRVGTAHCGGDGSEPCGVRGA
jgi:hypothetical protein